MKKTSFVLYTSFYSPISKLTREQKGDLLDAIFLHAMDEGVPEMDVATQIAFDFMRHQMDADKDKWNETCRKRSEAGKLGGAPKGNTNARKQAKTSKNKQKQAKQAEYEYEYEYEYEDEDDNNNADAEKQPKQPNACFKDELKADEVMLMAISSATAIQKDKLIELIPAFENELAINGKKHKNYTEYRLHFKNYASKKAEIERQQKTQDNGKLRANTQRRRREIDDFSQVKSEDYHESF